MPFSSSGGNVVIGMNIYGDTIVGEDATDGQSNYFHFDSVVHAPGSVGLGSILSDPHLGFNGPHLLDDASGAPSEVLNLLNADVGSDNFVLIPQ